jgi:TonB family protein
MFRILWYLWDETRRIMTEFHRKKRFLVLPEYPGGHQAMKEFIRGSLRYPAAAEEARIEGFVIVAYDVDDDGIVENAHIQKSLGHGCDEEALRVIGLLRFEKVRNRGKRVKVTKKTRINFRAPKKTATVSVTYHSEPAKPKNSPEPGTPGAVTYNYTIDL